MKGHSFIHSLGLEEELHDAKALWVKSEESGVHCKYIKLDFSFIYFNLFLMQQISGRKIKTNLPQLGNQGVQVEMIQRVVQDINGDDVPAIAAMSSVRQKLGISKRNKQGAHGEYKVGDLVWAKSKTNQGPKWPAIVRKLDKSWADEVSGCHVEYIGQTSRIKVCLVKFLNV